MTIGVGSIFVNPKASATDSGSTRIGTAVSFLVGTTTGAPTNGASTWTSAIFANVYPVLVINGIIAHMSDMGDGSPYISKASAASTTVTINNYVFQTGDIIDVM